MHPDKKEYARVWSDYRADKRMLCWLLILFFPVLYGVVKPLYSLYRFDWILLGLAIGWPVFVGFYFLRIYTFRCPRCGHRFFYRDDVGRMESYWSNHCVHCGLPKYGNVDGPEAGNEITSAENHNLEQ